MTKAELAMKEMANWPQGAVVLKQKIAPSIQEKVMRENAFIAGETDLKGRTRC